MVVVSADQLRNLTLGILRAAGASDENAKIVADHLVEAQLSGVDTHGVFHLVFGGNYVDAIKTGAIIPDARPQSLWELPNSALVTGNWTFGHVVAEYATDVLTRLACASGMAAVGIVQANHIGRLGHYTERLAAADLVGIVCAGGFSEEIPAAIPFGGRSPLLSTNPLSMAFPGGREPRMMLDFATTTLSGSRVRQMGQRGQSVPAGAVVDRDGRPSTDANDYLNGGALALFGGHKGYAISMAVEFLTRILIGSDTYADDARSTPYERHQGVLMIALRADLFSSLDSYRARADDMVRRTHAVPPSPDFERVLMPGDPELESRRAREASGIEIDDELWARLTALPTA
jgi:LDH2 family malate/lactate/ureidoglycolate dehydrogenase